MNQSYFVWNIDKKNKIPRHQYECVSHSINNYFENMCCCCFNHLYRLYDWIGLLDRCCRLRCGRKWRIAHVISSLSHNIQALVRDVVVKRRFEFLAYFLSHSRQIIKFSRFKLNHHFDSRFTLLLVCISMHCDCVLWTLSLSLTLCIRFSGLRTVLSMVLPCHFEKDNQQKKTTIQEIWNLSVILTVLIRSLDPLSCAYMCLCCVLFTYTKYQHTYSNNEQTCFVLLYSLVMFVRSTWTVIMKTVRSHKTHSIQPVC